MKAALFLSFVTPVQARKRLGESRAALNPQSAIRNQTLS
jgi:hypothetical protein